MKNFFAQDPILQEYAVMEAFEILSGKRKDFTSLHVDQVLSLLKKRNGRYINLPESLRVIRQYGGVCLKKNFASDGENAASTVKKSIGRSQRNVYGASGTWNSGKSFRSF